MNYGVLISNDDVFIILNDKIMENEIGDINKIENVKFVKNSVIFYGEKEVSINIINIEDRKILQTKEGYVSIINKAGESVKILEITRGI